MDASQLQAIGDTLMRLVNPGMTPKELVRAVRKENPGSHAIISNADQDPGKARNLQAFALAERTRQSE